MSPSADSSLDDLLARERPDDVVSRNEVLTRTRQRLERMVHARLPGFPDVKRWEDTDDVLQPVLLRMDKVLCNLPVDSAADFFRLAACQIRQHLLDLFRHYRKLILSYQTPFVEFQGGQVPTFLFLPRVQLALLPVMAR